MNKNRLILHIGLALLAALLLAVLGLAQSEEVVKAKGYASVDAIRPGDKFSSF